MFNITKLWSKKKNNTVKIFRDQSGLLKTIRGLEVTKSEDGTLAVKFGDLLL
jgi:hypothetical protein